MGQSANGPCGCCGGSSGAKVQGVPLFGDSCTPQGSPSLVASCCSPRRSARSPASRPAPRCEDEVDEEARPKLPPASSSAAAKDAGDAGEATEENEHTEEPIASGLAWAKAQNAVPPGPAAGETRDGAQEVSDPVSRLENKPNWMREDPEGTRHTGGDKMSGPEDRGTAEPPPEETGRRGGSQSLCCGLIRGGKRQSKAFSAVTRAKVFELFAKLDRDGDGEVTKKEALGFFQNAGGKFGGLSVDAMFNEVDVDRNGLITAEEFVEFWEQVWKSGYTEADLREEMDQIIEGGFWVDWADDRKVA